MSARLLALSHLNSSPILCRSELIPARIGSLNPSRILCRSKLTPARIASLNPSLILCRSELIPAFVRLLRDSEAEVRGAAGGKVAQFCSLLGANESCVVAVLPCVKELAADSNQFVRAALASVVMELAPMLGKAATIEHLLPVFLALLKDDFPDVRLNIISKLDQVRFFHAYDLNLQPAAADF